MDRSTPVFVLGLGMGGLEAVRGFARLGIPVRGFDIGPRRLVGYPPLGFASRYGRPRACPDPEWEPRALLRFLLEAGARHAAPAMLFPTSDAFLLFLSRERERLSSAFRIALAPPAVAEAGVDKRAQVALAARAGLLTPRTWSPRAPADLRAIAAELDYPVLLKPVHAHRAHRHFGGRHKGFVVRDPAQLHARFALVWEAGLEYLVQSIVPGPDNSLFEVSAYVDQCGEALGQCVVRKVRQYPVHFGIGTLTQTVRDPELEALALRLLRAIGYRGVAEVEFKRDARDGRPYFIELNARLSAQASLLRRCGVNLPLLQYLDLTGQRPRPAPPARSGVRWLAAELDLLSFLHSWRYERLGVGAWLRSLRGVRALSTFAPDDPGPFLSANLHRALRLPLFLAGKD